jgi:hypothetical protein
MPALAQPPAAPPPYRTPPALRRMLAVLAGVVALAMVAFGTVELLDLAARQTTTERASYDDVRVLELEGSGDVRITGAPAGSPVRVVLRVTEGLRSPERRAERSSGGGTLRLSSSCPIFLTSQCAVRYDVSVPPDVQVRADSGAGDVVAEDLVSDQPISLDTSAGDVTATGLSAPSVRLHSSAGDVVARGLDSQRVQATSSAGDVRVSLPEPPLDLDADSSAGDVELVVPDAVYRLDADSSAGDVDTREVRVDRDARHAIRARSSAGDVRVDVRR